MRLDRKSRNQRAKGIGGFREVKESHPAALWLGGLEAITDGLRGSKDLVLAGAKPAEASLFAAKPSS